MATAKPAGLVLTAQGSGRDLVAPSKKGVFEKTFGFLRNQIAEGSLRSGDRLLPERELAQRLGVSRTSLREVLRAIEILGLLEIRPGQGVYVQRPSLEILKEMLGVALSMDPGQFDGVLEARAAIECQAIRIACRNATEEDFTQLRAALGRLIATIHEGGLGGDDDYAFHTIIVHASKNKVLLVLYEALQAILRKSHRERREAIRHVPKLETQLGAAHEALFQSIVDGDEDAAEQQMRRHFNLAQDYFRSNKAKR